MLRAQESECTDRGEKGILTKSNLDLLHSTQAQTLSRLVVALLHPAVYKFTSSQYPAHETGSVGFKNRSIDKSDVDY